MNILEEFKKLVSNASSAPKSLEDAEKIREDKGITYNWKHKYKDGELGLLTAYAWSRIDELNKEFKLPIVVQGDFNEDILCRANFNNDTGDAGDPTGWYILKSYLDNGKVTNIRFFDNSNVTFDESGKAVTRYICYKNANFETFKRYFDSTLLSTLKLVKTVNEFNAERQAIKSKVESEMTMLKSMQDLKIKSLINITNFNLKKGT